MRQQNSIHKFCTCLIAWLVLSTPVMSAYCPWGPSVQNVSKNEASIIWAQCNTESPKIFLGNDSVNISLVNGDGIYTVKSYGADGTMYKARLTGLDPGKYYFYKVQTAGFQSRVFGFKTAPPDTGRRFKFFAGGEGQWRERPADVQKMCRLLGTKYRPEFYLNVGDNYAWSIDYGATRQFFNGELEILARASLFMAPGNHDLLKSGDWNQAYPPSFFDIYDFPENGMARTDGFYGYYSFDWGRCHFISINTGPNEIYTIPPEHRNWVVQDLQKAQGKYDWIITYFHAPIYTAGSSSKTKSAYEQIFKIYNVDVVFQGHHHGYVRCNPQKLGGVLYMETSGFASPRTQQMNDYVDFAYGGGKSFTMVEVNGYSMRFITRDPNENIIDDFTYSKDSAVTENIVMPNQYAGFPLSIQPNPVQGEVIIQYQVKAGSGRVLVTLKIFDLSGQLVYSPVSRRLYKGQYQVAWHCRTSGGHKLPNGIYTLRLTVNNKAFSKRVILIK